MTADLPAAATPPPPSPLPIALDAMGGDRAPDVVVEGAARACLQGHGPLILVGDEGRIRACLQAYPRDLPIQVVHASETIGMGEHPGRAARAKRNSSIHVGYGLVKKGTACAFVSAGNSGAMMAVGLLTLRRIPGCDRPAFAAALPSQRGPVVVLDLGGNVECRASHLVQFGLMGAAFAEIHLGTARPSVGLLSNGTEPTKGTETLREAHRLLNLTDLKYTGYIEGRAVPRGDTDVVVTDGFVGNVVLKLSEGVAAAIMERVRAEVNGTWRGRLGGWLLRPSFRKLRTEMDWANIGGAPILGLDGVALVAHGASTEVAIASAVRSAREFSRMKLVARLRRALEGSGTADDRTSTAELPITRASGAHDLVS